MDNLFFRLQENKQFQRQILILQYLNKKDHPSTSKELSNVTKTSSPTLRSDIEALRQILPKEMAITFQKRIGYQLMVPRSPKIETIILDLAKHTPVFQLIDQYFRGRIRSLQSAAATLYSSQSRIRKIIKQ
nr:helix-turn-helix domain-containing protein [Enterococcus sp.]